MGVPFLVHRFGLHTIPESQQRPIGTVDPTDMEAFAVPTNVNYANPGMQPEK